MERTAFAVWAGVLLPLGALATSGCETGVDRGAVADAPAVRAPWAHLRKASFETAEEPADEEPADEEVQADAQAESGNDVAALASDEQGPAESPAAPVPVEVAAAPEPKMPEPAAEAPAESPPAEELPLDDEPAVVAVPERIAALPNESTLELRPEHHQVAPAVPPVTAAPTVDPERQSLPWGAASRSPVMKAAARRANQRVRHGFELAARGAAFAARSEFVGSLQILAEANDTQQKTRLYSRALTAGLTALKESSTFLTPSANGAESTVAGLVAHHKTAVLKDEDLDQLTPAAAAERYADYAQEQLALAAAREVTGSMALYGLAKVALVNARMGAGRSGEPLRQGMTLYKAALIASPANYWASNELGVLYAETGQLERARDLLIESVMTQSEATTWHNLAVVHARLGETDKAQLAEAKSRSLGKPITAPGVPQVEWMTPEAFAGVSNPAENLLPPLSAGAQPQPSASPAEVTNKPPVRTAKRSIIGWSPAPRR